MTKMPRSLSKFLLSVVLASALAIGADGAARAAEPFTIPVVLPLTGNAAFLGQGEKTSLEIQEKVVNDAGGIDGTPIHYAFNDDQSSPQVAVQLANQIAAQHPSVILGSAIVAMCNAMTPLLADGPILYCFSPGIHPSAGAPVFTAFVSTHDTSLALVRYYRGRGFTRLAMITSTDASGQDGARGFEEALKLPENKDMKFVAEVQFSPTDVSVSAQIEQIKSSNAQALIAWTSGSPFGTVLKGIIQSGLDIPVGTTDANMTNAQMQQYASFMPSEALFMSTEWPEHTAELKLDPGVDAAQKVMFDAYKASGTAPDIAVAHAWDPGMLLVNAYRQLGLSAKPEQVRAYLAGVKDWAGINGVYDFEKTPQRGLDVTDSVVTRWQADKKSWVIVSRPGGEPL
jgi:branched-chain amino acid transport system substrate-binding protein